ncbi:hypothetical protein ACF0H5_020326 [Mactra antiquata]
MATRVHMEFNTLNNFGRASCKEHACQVSSNLAKWYWRRSRLNEKLTHGQWTTWCHKSSPCHFVTGELKIKTILKQNRTKNSLNEMIDAYIIKDNIAFNAM